MAEMDTRVERPKALITGASSGIGAAYASRLARDGFDLVIVARRGDRLQALSRLLQQDYRIAVEVIVADLARSEDLRSLEMRLAGDLQLDMLINNAGMIHAQPFNQLGQNEIEAMLQIHVVALTQLTRAVLPGMTTRGRGTIINVSSVMAFVPIPDSKGS
jgi:short-subunit dehydrogenase